MLVDGQAFVKRTWGAAIVDDLAPALKDIVVEGKRGLDAFASTNLDFILRSKGIETIILAGFLTNCCVESTMRSGYENGYRVITLTDCVAATSQEEHDKRDQLRLPDGLDAARVVRPRRCALPRETSRRHGDQFQGKCRLIQLIHGRGKWRQILLLSLVDNSFLSVVFDILRTCRSPVSVTRWPRCRARSTTS